MNGTRPTSAEQHLGDRLAALVDGEHGGGPRGQCRGDGLRVEVARRAQDVGEDRCGPAVAHHVGRGDERERRDDDLVARTDPQQVHAQVQGRGARGRRDAVCRPDRVGEGPLELGDARTLRHPAGADDLGDRCGLLLAQ